MTRSMLYAVRPIDGGPPFCREVYAASVAEALNKFYDTYGQARVVSARRPDSSDSVRLDWRGALAEGKTWRRGTPSYHTLRRMRREIRTVFRLYRRRNADNIVHWSEEFLLLSFEGLE